MIRDYVSPKHGVIKMNKTFKVFFSKARGRMVVASEAASSIQKKGAKTVIAIAVAVAMTAAGSAMAETWTNHEINADVTIAAGTTTTVDSVVMTSGALTVNGNLNRQDETGNKGGLFDFNGGSITVGDTGNFEVRDFTMTNGTVTASGAEGGNYDDDHARTAPAFGSYNSFVVNGGEINLSNGGRIWIGSANKNNPESYERMELNAGTINLNGNGFITGNKRFIAAGTYYETVVVGGKGTFAANVIGLDGATINVKGTGNVIDSAFTQLTDGSLTIAKDGVLTVRATTSTNQPEATLTDAQDALQASSYFMVDGGTLTIEKGGTFNTASAVESGKGYLARVDVESGVVNNRGNFNIGSSTLNINGGTFNNDGDLTASQDGHIEIGTGGVLNTQISHTATEGGNLQVNHVTVNDGGVFNALALNSKVQSTDEANNRLLIAFNNDWTLNGGDLQVAGETYTGRIKIGANGNKENGKGTGRLTIEGGQYHFDYVEFGSAEGNQLTVNGGLLNVGTLDLTVASASGAAHAVEVSSGTLAVNTLTTDAAGKLHLNGGTLQTGYQQAFITEAVLIDKDSSKVAKGEEATVAGLHFTATSGTLALTDEGYYTTDSLQAMSDALDGLTLNILSATLAEGETAKLVDGVVQATEQATAEVSATEGKATLQVANTGAQSLVLKASETGASVSEVTLSKKSGDSSSTSLTLVGSIQGGHLVENAQGAAVAVTVGEGVTLNLGSEQSAAETAGTLGNVTVANGGSLAVTNMTAQVQELVVGAADGQAQVTVGSNASRGALSVSSLTINSGSTVFLDPAWNNDQSLQTIQNASHFDVAEVKAINGNLVVGRNSVAALGASAQEAVNAFDAIAAINPEVIWGATGVTAALYVASPLTVGTNGKIVVDGALTSSGAFDNGKYASQVNVASGGMMVADVSGLGGKAIVNGTLFLDDGSYVGLVNATEGEVKLALGEVTQNGEVAVVTDNPFIVGEMGAGEQAGSVIATVDAKNGLAAIASTGMQSMMRNADMVLAQTVADRTSTDQEMKPGLNLWVDVTGVAYDTDELDNGGNYRADMGYGAFGGDIGFGDFTVGGALQYGTGSLRSSVSGIKNSIDNYGVSLYGTYKVTDAFKLAAELAYVWGENDITSTQTALNQSVDTTMYSAGVRAMYELKAGDFRFVPSIGLRVSRLSTDSMKIGQVTVDDQDQTLVQMPIALRVNAGEFQAGSWTVAPSMKVAYVPTFGDKDIEVLHHTQDVIDTSPVQADLGLRVGKDNMLFNVNMLIGGGEYGSSAVGGKVGFKYVF